MMAAPAMITSVDWQRMVGIGLAQHFAMLADAETMPVYWLDEDDATWNAVGEIMRFGDRVLYEYDVPVGRAGCLVSMWGELLPPPLAA